MIYHESYRNEICKRRECIFAVERGRSVAAVRGCGLRHFSHFSRDPLVSGISDVLYVCVRVGFRILGMRRPKEESGGELNRTEGHGVVLVLGIAGRSKDAKEGLAALERFEDR